MISTRFSSVKVRLNMHEEEEEEKEEEEEEEEEKERVEEFLAWPPSEAKLAELEQSTRGIARGAQGTNSNATPRATGPAPATNTDIFGMARRICHM